jgi:N4-gp56 family major capsid protein
MGATSVSYGTNGLNLGPEVQAKINYLATKYVVDDLIYDKFFTLVYSLPQKSGTRLKIRRWIDMQDLVIANKAYIDAVSAGNDDYVYKPGDLIHHNTPIDLWKDFVLTEGDSGTEFGKMQKVEIEADIFMIGSYMTVSEEALLYDPLYTIGENVKQYSRVYSKIINGFYRDTLFGNAGHHIDSGATGSDDATANAIKQISTNLRISGAEYINSIISASPKYATVPVYSRYVGYVNPLAIQDLEKNAAWVPVEKYAVGNVTPLKGERGMIGDVRIVEDFEAPIDTDNNKYKLIITGKDHSAQIPLRGKNGINVIIKNLGENGNDPLNRIGTIGIKTHLGAKTIYPEKVGVVEFKIS